jgi:hypothetical protein
VPLAGAGTDTRSNQALATLRDQVLPATLGRVSGVNCQVTRYRNGGVRRRHAGFVPALVHPGNVCLAEAMTGHLGHGKHDRPGGAAAGAAEDHDRGRVRFRSQAR